MAIDPNLILQAVSASKTPYMDPADHGLKMEQLRGLALQNQSQMQSLQRMQQLRELAAQSDFSTPEGRQTYLGAVGKVDPQQAVKMGHEWAQGDLATQKAFHETMKAKLEQATAARSYVGQVAGGITDQASYDAGLNTLRNYAAKIGDNDLLNELNQAPKMYDPAFVQREKTMALTGAQQAEQGWKQHQQEFERLKLEEEKRHNIAMEKKPNSATVALSMGGGPNADPSQPLSAAWENQAQLIARGEAPLMTPSARNPMAPIVNARAAQLAQANGQQLSGTQYAENTAARKDFGPNGGAGKTILALNTMTEHLATADRLADALANGNTPLFNQLSQALAKQTGGPAPTNFETLRQFLAGEVGKVAAGGHLTEGEINQAKSALSSAQSPAQLKGALQVMREVAGGKLVALDQDYQRYFPGRSISERLTPGTKQAFGAASQHIRGQQGPARISSDEEYRALPSGAEFIAPDGSHRRKP